MNNENEKSETVNDEVLTVKSIMQAKFKDQIEERATPYFDIFNRCTKAIIKELDSEETTVEVEEVRSMVNGINGYVKLIGEIVSNPGLQEAVVDFIIQLEEISPAKQAKLDKKAQQEEIISNLKKEREDIRERLAVLSDKMGKAVGKPSFDDIHNEHNKLDEEYNELNHEIDKLELADDFDKAYKKFNKVRTSNMPITEVK